MKMEKFLSLLVLTCLCLIACVLAVPEKVDHGARAHEKLHFKDGKHNPVFDYDALLGTEDADVLADLPDDVRKNRLTILAKSHDKNNNGIIEASELEEWIEHSFRVIDHKDADESLRQDDDNSDGKLSFPELLKNRYGYTEEEIEAFEIKENSGNTERNVEEDIEFETFRLIKEDRARFDSADLDHDGLLAGEEAFAFHHPYDFPHMFKHEVDRTMTDMDDNKDGIIQMEEFVRAKEDDKEERLSEVNHFEELDKDKDGKLTRDEITPFAVLDNSEMVKEEVEHLIRECDEDQDGHLSIEEIIKKEEDFVSGQATYYGKHLHFIKEEL